jgi:hypothetical protein
MMVVPAMSQENHFASQCTNPEWGLSTRKKALSHQHSAFNPFSEIPNPRL